MTDHSQHGNRADAGTAARRVAALDQALQARATPQGFDTAAIHAGYRPDGQTGAINVPIYASTTYAQDDVACLRGGYEYARVGNPTVTALEQVVARLEGGLFARAFASGMAATDTLLRALLRPGGHVVLGNDVYGGTFRLLDTSLKDWGVRYSVVDTADAAQVKAAIEEDTRVVWLETPSNPLLAVTDIQAVVAAARGSGAAVVVDNTFATPYLQRPLEFGADVVVHSATKYLGGHSDVLGGLVVTSDETLDEELLFLQGGVGAVPSPFEAYLAYRGIKTLGVRMDRHSHNARALAEYFASRPEVATVHYPGLESHPGHEVAERQMADFGGMISIELAGGEEAALEFCRSTRLFCLAESLGGVESLLEHPARMTHQSAANSPLEIGPGLVRLSVGIENLEDLLADVEQALNRVGSATRLRA